MLKLTNSLTNSREIFTPPTNRPIRLYVCGITPYDFSHIGHGRVYVTFDLLYRLLQFLGHPVSYCRNFTDIDDKLIKKAVNQYHDPQRYSDVANTYIEAFGNDMQALNCLTPTYEPRVTDNIPAIIECIEQLVTSGAAYQADGDVYFHIARAPSYGILSKHNLADLRAGARVEPNEKKQDPLDFALWKSEPEGTFWSSPFGWGRPGWHIECSALARRYLGDQIDIHGGGMDLLFPHHENEIAQTEALTHTPFSRFWVHNAFVYSNKEKMSKSLGNFFTLRDIFAHVPPMVVRFYFLNHHYRAPIEFSLDALKQCEKSYQKLHRIFSTVEQEPTTKPSEIMQKMINFLCDDLNSVGMLGVLFEQLTELGEQECKQMKYFLHTVLGLTFEKKEETAPDYSPEIQELIKERDTARKAGNWKRADELREELLKCGINVQDKKIK